MHDLAAAVGFASWRFLASGLEETNNEYRMLVGKSFEKKKEKAT